MTHCRGIDFHSNNHAGVVTDGQDKRVFEKRISNDLSPTLKAYRETFRGVVMESTCNYYWLVTGLPEQGYNLQSVNTAVIKQYDGLKYSNAPY